MAPIRSNSKLIKEHQIAVTKIKQQGIKWIKFFIISLVTSFIIMFLTYNAVHATVIWTAIVLATLIVTVSIGWWIWAILCIVDSVNNQLYIFTVLHDITIDLATIREDLLTDFNSTKK